MVLVVAAGWLFGLLPGICAALLSFCLNLILCLLSDIAWKDILLGGGGIAGMLSLLMIGAILGRMRDLSRQLSAELSERMRTERELRESKEQLENLVETSLDPIVITDTAAVIKANRAFLDMMGYAEQEMLGKTLYEFSITTEGTYETITGEHITIGPEFLQQEVPEKMHELNRSGKVSNWETYYVNKNGKAILVTQNIVWLYDCKGEPFRAFAIIRNITEQREAEQALVASRQAAIEANQFRERFFTNLTHEFRTPLTLVIGPIEGLLRGDFGNINQEMDQQLTVALRNSRQLLKLIDQLLDFSMLESGGASLFLETKNIKDFFETVLSSFATIAQKKNITLTFRHASDVPPIPIDCGKMEKVLFNLIGNAFKYTPDSGTITITTALVSPRDINRDETLVTEVQAEDPASAATDMMLKIAVSDSGVGINQEHHRRIFERFQQTGESYAQEQGGSGLGLAYTKELVELMSGHVTVSSSPGEGATFCVYLPVSVCPEEDNRPARINNTVLQLDAEVETSDILLETDVPQERITGTKPLILIIDDNQDVCRYVAGIIRNDYDYVFAGNGREALRTMDKHEPDLIICDIMMPEMDGYTFLKKVKKNSAWKSIPFIFLTAKADTAMKIEGLEEGADDYIAKPFNALELLARIRSLLRLRTLMLETRDQKKEIGALSRKLEERYSYGNIIGNSPAMRKIFQILESIKESDANILITGETGTGKELIANAIHYGSSRKKKPFISVNCGAVPKELMEREFFGHVKGAYTGAVRDAKGFFLEADGGTLFLDEIAEMDKDLQVKLLRVLEKGEFSPVGSSSSTKVNVRIIVATNKLLGEEVLSGNFREDLYFRVNVIPIHIPPLRQRRADIPLLIDHFLAAYRKKHKKEPLPFTQQDMKFFLEYSYPGNIRELEHMLERFWLMGSIDDTVLGDRPYEQGVQVPTPGTYSGPVPASTESLKEARERFEKKHIIITLEKCNYNHSRAAEQLKISRVALYKKIKQYELKNK